MNKSSIFTAAPEFSFSLLITKHQFGPFAELLVLPEAFELLRNQTNHILFFFSVKDQ